MFGGPIQALSSKAKKARSNSRNSSDSPMKPFSPVNIAPHNVIEIDDRPPKVPTFVTQPVHQAVKKPEIQAPAPVVRNVVLLEPFTNEQAELIKKHLKSFAQQSKLAWDVDKQTISWMLLEAFDSPKLLDHFINHLTMALSKYPLLFEALLGIKHKLSINKFIDLTYLRSALRSNPGSFKRASWLLLAVNSNKERFFEILRSLCTSDEFDFLRYAALELEVIDQSKVKNAKLPKLQTRPVFGLEFAAVQYVVQSTTVELAPVVDHAPHFARFCQQLGISSN